MNVSDYKNIREAGKRLAYKILGFKKNNQSDIIYAGKQLGFWDGQAMMFENDEESDVLMDFLIYERNKKGIKLIDEFYESDIALSDVEEEILEGMAYCRASFYEIAKIDSSISTLILKDLLDPNQIELKLMDLGLSQTAIVGMTLYSRLLSIGSINMTSGVSFAFDISAKNKMLGEISFNRMKKNGKINSSDLFVLAHKRSKQYGINVMKLDTK